MTRLIGSLLLLALAAFVAFVVGFAIIRGASLCLLDAIREVLP